MSLIKYSVLDIKTDKRTPKKKKQCILQGTIAVQHTFLPCNLVVIVFKMYYQSVHYVTQVKTTCVFSFDLWNLSTFNNFKHGLRISSKTVVLSIIIHTCALVVGTYDTGIAYRLYMCNVHCISLLKLV